jgi:uncharacterized membrane protein
MSSPGDLPTQDLPSKPHMPQDTIDPGRKSAPQTVQARTDDVSTAVMTAWAAPLPPPSVLADYDRVVPGLGLAMSQGMVDEGHTRRQIRRAAAAAEIADTRETRRQEGRGQVFGFVIGVVSLVLGFTAIMCNHDWAGAIIGGGGLAGIVSVFVTGRLTDTGERASTAKAGNAFGSDPRSAPRE